MEDELTLQGSGRPYRLNTWTGAIEPIAAYTADADGVTVHVRIAPYDAVILALATKAAEPVAAPDTHAVTSTGEVLTTGGQTLTLRADHNGRYDTTLSNGAKVTTDVTGLAAGAGAEHLDAAGADVDARGEPVHHGQDRSARDHRRRG